MSNTNHRPGTPGGIRNWEPAPYGYRRWNGTVWVNAWVDRYNRQVQLIRQRYDAGYDVDDYVNDLYRMANEFDHIAKPHPETTRKETTQ